MSVKRLAPSGQPVKRPRSVSGAARKPKPKLPAILAASAKFDPKQFLARIGAGRSIAKYPKDRPVFTQGETASAVYYVQKGKVKISVLAKSGKEAVLGILGPGDFFGEGCLAGQPKRMASATTMTDSSVMRIDRDAMIRVLHSEPKFADVFTAFLLARTLRIEEDLMDQLFNSSEKRLARLLLILANFGKEGKPEPIIPKISQEVLAEMIGTTRSRVSHFMNKFRRHGFIHYNGGLQVHSSLLTVVLRD
jgi:CRP/FNR family cyclic AMP-dependent transcriptional regulator